MATSVTPTRSTFRAADPWFPFLLLLVQVLVFGVGCLAIESSGLEQGPESWGYVLTFVVLTVFYGSWPLVATLMTALLATLTSSPAGALRLAWAGAVIAAVFGLCSLGTGVYTIGTAKVEAESWFGVVIACSSVPALVAPWLQLRLTRR